MKRKNIIIMMVAMFILSSCDDDKGPSEITSNPEIKINENAPKASKKKHFKESYQFEVNGCDTWRHDFNSSSKEEVKKKLCDALQDEKLNNFCARSLREDLFYKKCAGMVWFPEDNDHIVNVDFTRSLRNLVASEISLNENLKGDDKVYAEEMAQKFSDCTFSYSGPKCLSTYTYMNNGPGKMYEVKGREVFFVEVDFQNNEDKIALIFSLSEEDGKYRGQDVKVYKVYKRFNPNESLSSFIDNKDFVLKLFSAKISENPMETLIEKAKKPNNLREQYHSYYAFREIALLDGLYFYGGKNKELLEYFNQNNSLIAESDDFKYQYSMLNFIKYHLGMEAKNFVSVCEKLVNVEDNSLRQYAAVHVFEHDLSRDELKDDVLAAFDHKKWNIRVRAINALSRVALNLNEEVLLFKKLDDLNREVRAAAKNAISKLDMTEDHVVILSELQTSLRWDTRHFVIVLLGKISGHNATSRLIESMDDNDNDVRAEVNKQLFSRELFNKDLNELKGKMNSDRWDVRYNALKLIGKVSGNGATKLIINKMSDSIWDIREEAISQLKLRTMNELLFDELKVQLNSSYWDVRYNVLKLINEISGHRVTKLIINKMSDSIWDIRKEAISQLKLRTMNESVIDELEIQLNSNFWDVRREAAKFLGAINSQSSMDALVNRLAIENNFDVKKEIKKSIDSLR